ncbi:hypothetical protein T265_08197 [Opisthorchis viverrini]|uniref:UDP-N-acetylglucosamine diphosphorylase n=2 Tax=Opisthorchis viverrini TaxID=6198 RepID=A0A074Z9Z0_OPIVI|nr:hypothetical protein T265_08197 [Opisthorchis viverrini]KER24066.1 hypothetical protein T265_08197 [Opisthorchis viverrini]
MCDYRDFFESAKNSGQGHIFAFWNELDEKERGILLRSARDINFGRVAELTKARGKVAVNFENRLLPPDEKICGCLSYLRSTDPLVLDKYHMNALQAVHEGKVAILLLAGGQGTRLGSPLPKGLFCPNLPSGRSLYQIQAEHILRVVRLARAKFGSTASIPWYIMTSEHTEETTRAFFKSHNYFGHDPKNIILFEQFTLPAIGFDGKILMDQKYKPAMAPDGNGGLYNALRERHILDDMAARGVEYVQIYCVDNILVKLPDTYFIGFCMDKSAECAAQVVQKRNPTEPIGVVGMVDGRYRVLEYSEISPETAALRRSDNGHGDTLHSVDCADDASNGDSERLVYSHGNICVHFVTREFLTRVCKPEMTSRMEYHVAKKKVPYVDVSTGQRIIPSEPNGIKFEQFVFDVFPFAERFAIWEVPRKEYFSPLKNGPTATADCPRTSRTDYLAFHAKLARDAGASLSSDLRNENGYTNRNHSEAVIEISPLVSGIGECLTCLSGRELTGVNLLEWDDATGQPTLRSAVTNDSME